MVQFERFLESTLEDARLTDCPPLLGQAMHYAVFPGGARIRPRLVIAVAKACGARPGPMVASVAASIELLHCASLVHDDLPCFDDADFRRGKASVHKVFGEPLAVLTGDALIVLAFETVARHATAHPSRMAALVAILGKAVGTRGGIVAGQAWEAEASIDLARYHQAKTGALFAGATMAGATAAGQTGAAWRALGERLGSAFQVADDIRDVAGSSGEIGKPAGRDAILQRPNIALERGVPEAIEALDAMIEDAVSVVPECPGQVELQALIRITARSFLPESLMRRAA